MLNANRVKLASLDNSVYLFCSYKSSNSFEDSLLNRFGSFVHNFINVFRYIDKVDVRNRHSRDTSDNSKLVFVSAVNNFTSAKSIHHLSSNNDFFFTVKRENIDVYWWDGHSLIYYETLLEHKPLTFALHKIGEKPPLIISSDGVNLHLYYKEFSKFIREQIHFPIRSGYSLESIQLFSFNRDYFAWLKFSEIGNFKLSVRSYSQLVRIQTRLPDSTDEIHNLDTCLSDLRSRIEGEIRTVKTLKRKSENLLVITPTKPYIEVDVIVNDTFRTKKTAPKVKLSVPSEFILFM